MCAVIMLWLWSAGGRSLSCCCTSELLLCWPSPWLLSKSINSGGKTHESSAEGGFLLGHVPHAIRYCTSAGPTMANGACWPCSWSPSYAFIICKQKGIAHLRAVNMGAVQESKLDVSCFGAQTSARLARSCWPLMWWANHGTSEAADA